MVLKRTYQKYKTRIGQVQFANSKMHFFAGHSRCDHCGINTRVLLDIDEARMFGKCFARPKQPIGLQIAQKLARHYEAKHYK